MLCDSMLVIDFVDHAGTFIEHQVDAVVDDHTKFRRAVA